MAVNYHVGMVGLTVAAQLPLVDVEPNQHPIDQLQKTLDAAWELKEAIHWLWESLAKGPETVRELSDGATFSIQELSKESQERITLNQRMPNQKTKEESMADFHPPSSPWRLPPARPKPIRSRTRPGSTKAKIKDPRL